MCLNSVAEVAVTGKLMVWVEICTNINHFLYFLVQGNHADSIVYSCFIFPTNCLPASVKEITLKIPCSH